MRAVCSENFRFIHLSPPSSYNCAIMGTREASHAGSWYADSGPELSAQLDEWLAQVPDNIPGIGTIPLPGARVVISPHAGFAYSGPCAAWAYRSLDLSKA